MTKIQETITKQRSKSSNSKGLVFVIWCFVCILYLVSWDSSSPFLTVVRAQPIESMSSVDLVTKAWEAFNNKDYEEAVTFSNACILRYGKSAQKMQATLKDYPTGKPEAIHAFYALNDVATALYIKAESLRKLERSKEAESVYQQLLDQYSFGQCWDPRGWFWKPAVVAREKLAMLKTGKFYDFGDYSSMNLMILSWKALDEEDVEAALVFTNKAIELYGKEADKMQAALTYFPGGKPETIHSYYALNDVGTAYFIAGEAYILSGRLEQAREAYQTVVDRYGFAQCWDPRGWFWKVATGAKEKIDMIDEGMFKVVPTSHKP